MVREALVSLKAPSITLVSFKAPSSSLVSLKALSIGHEPSLADDDDSEPLLLFRLFPAEPTRDPPSV